MNKCYEMAKNFKKKYPLTICFRLKKHCKVVDEHLNKGEKVLYAFAAQKSSSVFEFFFTSVVVLTNKRIILATKRVLWGYFYVSITPDMFNDLTVRKGLIWGSVLIDTVKEKVILSSIAPSALDELETVLSEYMMSEKKKYLSSTEK